MTHDEKTYRARESYAGQGYGADSNGFPIPPFCCGTSQGITRTTQHIHTTEKANKSLTQATAIAFQGGQ
jgi:hypothetical protein